MMLLVQIGGATAVAGLFLLVMALCGWVILRIGNCVDDPWSEIWPVRPLAVWPWLFWRAKRTFVMLVGFGLLLMALAAPFA